MVMADRDGVEVATGPIKFLAVTGLVGTMVNGLARVPFARPWQGPAGILDNIGRSVTRQAVRSFLGYLLSLPIEEYRAMEKVLDQVCSAVLPPVVGGVGRVEIEKDRVGGVDGVWVRSKDDVQVDRRGDPIAIRGTILYLHGGGYVATTPMMYTMFAAALVRLSGCRIFIPDYRMAPEFPYPAGMHDAAAVYRAFLDSGIPAEHLILAGDSGGGGLATSLVIHLREQGLPRPAAMALFSPEVDLDLSDDSVVENARSDVLPWSIPVAPYLKGALQPGDDRVSTRYAHPDPEWFPPTFLCWGGEEMFRDSCRAFAERLRGAGLLLKAMEEEGMFHVFPLLLPASEASKRVFRALAELAAENVTPADEVPSVENVGL
ncbi:MAG: alpha/beta hydrolase [Gordonia sp. (in: high G+C Gram-positive bacteria)]|uniref:alpha/beta hydrolase n=1 Tax=Gordonia sp. (in: high G+C Gram-positive bacteria) TaxID=84139 RepID=UPI0039E51A8C